MRIVIALGGNALLRRSDPMTTEVQRKNIEIAARAIAPLASEHSVVIVHGNGPQVGLLSLQADAYRGAEPYPLDVLDAGTQGKSVGFSQFTTVGVIAAAVAKATAWTCAPTATEQTVPIQSGVDAPIMGSSRVGDPDGVGI